MEFRGKTYTLKCENCGSNITAEEGKDVMYCQYCGTKLVLIKQGATTEDAEIAKAKSAEAIRIKELEMRNRELEAKARIKEKEADARGEAAGMTVLGIFFVGVFVLIILYKLGIIGS